YEALSYVWGDDSKPCRIEIDNRALPITRSLFNVLVRVRSTTEVKPLWADGICINQDDNKEKAVQVAMMSELYLYATRVQVHLGPQADGSEHIPTLLENIDREPTNDLWKLLCPPNTFPPSDLPQNWHGRWEIVQKFFLRPWFFRAWVIQEAALAR
ncbi:heterokaryon incompatibility, partial [Tothia fuscella]